MVTVRLREAPLTAMRARDRAAVRAEASAGAIEHSPAGVDAAEATRREVGDAEAVEIVRGEVAAREAAAREYEAADRAEVLRAAARVLSAYLPGGRTADRP